MEPGLKEKGGEKGEECLQNEIQMVVLVYTFNSPVLFTEYVAVSTRALPFCPLS